MVRNKAMCSKLPNTITGVLQRYVAAPWWDFSLDTGPTHYRHCATTGSFYPNNRLVSPIVRLVDLTTWPLRAAWAWVS